jgi:hypothetical protein
MKAFINPPSKIPFYLKAGIWITKYVTGKAAQAVPVNNVDISKSLSPFVMVFDINKNLLATSGVMSSSKPTYPKGVLDSVAKNGQERVTWQPQTGLRYATVAIKSNGGYVVAGQSLSETEKLIDEIG